MVESTQPFFRYIVTYNKMFFFKNYFNNIINYDLLIKFNYKSIKKLPSIKKLVLTIYSKNFSKLLSSSLLLELITSSKSALVFSKKPNVVLKVQAGVPVGCKVTLRKNKMFYFLSGLLLFSIPKGSNLTSNMNKKNYNSFSFTLNNIFIFHIAEKNYNFFKDLDFINISLVTNSYNINELFLIIRSLKFIKSF